jgi:hypothetical protein
VLYGFVIIALERREIMHVGVTAHPTAECTNALSKQSTTARRNAFSCVIATASPAQRFEIV